MTRSLSTAVLAIVLAVVLAPTSAGSEEAVRHYFCRQTALKKSDQTPTYFYSNVFQTTGRVSDTGVGSRFSALVQQRYGNGYALQAGSTVCFMNLGKEAATDKRGTMVALDHIAHRELMLIDDFSY